MYQNACVDALWITQTQTNKDKLHKFLWYKPNKQTFLVYHKPFWWKGKHLLFRKRVCKNHQHETMFQLLLHQNGALGSNKNLSLS